MGEIILRAACAGEGHFLFEITERSVRALADRHYSAEQIDHWMSGRSAGYYERIIAAGGTTVACDGAHIVGYVDAVPGEIKRLFVAPGVVGKGLGTRLLHVGLVRARQGHAGPLLVLATLNAEGFYARHGFVRQGTTTYSGEAGSVDLDLVVMLRHDAPE